MSASTPSPSYPRLLQALSALVITAAMTGYVVGLWQPVVPVSPDPAPDPLLGIGAGQAVSYSERPAHRLGPNRAFATTLPPSSDRGIDPSATIEVDPEAKQATLARRRERRAYMGAPPVVPHPLEQRSAASCLACHGRPLVIDGRNVPQISHPEYTNCTQCHVEARATEHLAVRSHDDASPFVASSFRGLAEPTAGSRAYPGAPPVIPHTTRMRSDCLACHGPQGWEGLESTHPWRTNCLQCHGVSAELDQREVPPPPFPPGLDLSGAR